MNVKPSIVRSTSLAAASADRDLTCVQVCRVRIQLIDRNSGLKMHIEAEIQAVERMPPTVFSEHVIAVDVDDVATVAIERTDGKLVAQQAEIASDEIEQRADRFHRWQSRPAGRPVC